MYAFMSAYSTDNSTGTFSSAGLPTVSNISVDKLLRRVRSARPALFRRSEVFTSRCELQPFVGLVLKHDGRDGGRGGS